jgi:glyoxylase-like metal-dependent hydrolase (beta-lactamase superfamily II)
MDKTHQPIPGVNILPSHFPILNMGFLAINAFVIRAREPVLVDTGMGIDSEEFMKALASILDPGDLKWVWLTHDDADHTGSLQKVLEAAPNARLVTNSLAALRMSTVRPLAMDRVYWLNPGDSIDVGDRKLTAFRPPLFDNPTAIGAYDDKSQALFSVDCFGAIIPSPVENADDLSADDLAQGMVSWASADSPWVHLVEPNRFGVTLDAIRRMAPTTVFSGHLPPARGRTEQLLELLARVPASSPFVTPDQTVLEQLLLQMREGN